MSMQFLLKIDEVQRMNPKIIVHFPPAYYARNMVELRRISVELDGKFYVEGKLSKRLQMNSVICNKESHAEQNFSTPNYTSIESARRNGRVAL